MMFLIFIYIIEQKRDKLLLWNLLFIYIIFGNIYYFFLLLSVEMKREKKLQIKVSE